MALSNGTITADFTLVIAGAESTDLQGYADLVPSKTQVTDGTNQYLVARLRCPIVDGVLYAPAPSPNAYVNVTAWDHEVSWAMSVELPGHLVESRKFVVNSGQTVDYVDALPVVPEAPPNPIYATVGFDTDGTPYLLV